MVDPEKRFKCGACIATVFANEVETADGPKKLKRATLQRVYKDRDGTFKYTASFKPNDIPKAMLALSKAYGYLTSDDPPG